MKTKIPSPVLARIQLMFQSGATMDEVTAALDLDTTWQDAQQAKPVTAPQPVAAPQPVITGQPANDTRGPRIGELSAKLEEHVSQLMERDDVRDLPALSGALDSIYQHAVAIRNEVKLPATVSVAPANIERPAAAPKMATKKSAPKAAKKAAFGAPPPPIKVQPPKKKKAKDALQPTGELPSIGRRNLVHPLQAKPAAPDQSTKAKPVQAAAQRQTERSPSQPSNQYRDRIALAMSQISTFDDDHERDEDRIAARNS